MDDKLNDIFIMAVTFAAWFAILFGIIDLLKKSKNKKISIILIIGGLLIIIFFKVIIGSEIVPLG